MNFNQHKELEGAHAVLSASKYHWLNYDREKMASTYRNLLNTSRGSELHDVAHKLIQLGIKLPDTGQTLNMYVNDAIGYRMASEQVLYFSPNAFGTADAISFRYIEATGRWMLRVHDLKTGVGATSFHQLEIYVAFFCLEYNFKPMDIDIELRIYQNDDVRIEIPDLHAIMHAMDQIVTLDNEIELVRAEELG
jgi:hypothetical protein